MNEELVWRVEFRIPGNRFWSPDWTGGDTQELALKNYKFIWKEFHNIEPEIRSIRLYGIKQPSHWRKNV